MKIYADGLGAAASTAAKSAANKAGLYGNILDKTVAPAEPRDDGPGLAGLLGSFFQKKEGPAAAAAAPDEAAAAPAAPAGDDRMSAFAGALADAAVEAAVERPGGPADAPAVTARIDALLASVAEQQDSLQATADGLVGLLGSDEDAAAVLPPPAQRPAVMESEESERETRARTKRRELVMGDMLAQAKANAEARLKARGGAVFSPSAIDDVNAVRDADEVVR